MNKKYLRSAVYSVIGALLICGCTQKSKNTTDSQKGFEQEAVDTLHILEVGEKAVDAELFDMQGNKHRLFEAFADGRYVLLDFWNLGCGACRQSESELLEVYERMKGRLEIVGINLDSIPRWQNHEWSKKIVWKNWNDGKGYKGGIKSHYFDWNFVPFYVLLSPDGRILWEMAGYGTGCFLGIAEALNGPKQDNYDNPNLAIRKVDAGNKGTTISFRYYTEKGFWFNIAHDSYLTANSKKYKLTAADGIALDENITPQTKAYTVRAKYGTEINCCDFTLTFEPFDTIPTTFDFKEGDGEDVFVIRNVSVK
jgi:thiol-disulfide isomerase/thioredoxin